MLCVYQCQVSDLQDSISLLTHPANRSSNASVASLGLQLK
jgi:hypothetical protein